MEPMVATIFTNLSSKRGAFKRTKDMVISDRKSMVVVIIPCKSSGITRTNKATSIISSTIGTIKGRTLIKFLSGIRNPSLSLTRLEGDV